MIAAYRPVVIGSVGMVSAGHPAASLAGAEMLRAGGNAVDACVAASAALAVTIPYMNGLGGDAIGLVYDAKSGGVTAVNASGTAPAAATAEHYRQQGHTSVPQRGPLSISVPGIVQGWHDCLERWGARSLSACLEFAVSLAEEGSGLDQSDVDFYAGPVYAELAATYPALARTFPEPGRHPVGLRVRQPALGRTLRRMADEGAATFYRGEVGRAIAADLARAGVLLSEADLDQHRTLFQESLSVDYRNRRVHAAPPNAQGVALSVMLGLAELEGDASIGGDLDVERYMARKRIAFDLRDRYACDPARSDLPTDLLSDASLRALLSRNGAADRPAPGGGGDTTTLVVIDAQGNAVSWVQSLFEEFGSGVISESTGVVLHNRLCLERLDGDPVHQLAPGKRPFHTLCPALVVGDGRCEMSIATPGDHGQPQTLYQVMRNVYEDGLSIQAAIEEPRIRHDSGARIMVEDRAPRRLVAAIQAAGYEPEVVMSWSRKMGGVTAIQRSHDGLLMGAGDPRRSCYAIAAGP